LSWTLPVSLVHSIVCQNCVVVRLSVPVFICHDMHSESLEKVHPQPASATQVPLKWSTS
jgi:hypothetical protein